VILGGQVKAQRNERELGSFQCKLTPTRYEHYIFLIFFDPSACQNKLCRTKSVPQTQSLPTQSGLACLALYNSSSAFPPLDLSRTIGRHTWSTVHPSSAENVPRLFTRLLLQPAIHAVRHVRRTLRTRLWSLNFRLIFASSLCLNRGRLRLWTRTMTLDCLVSRSLLDRFLLGIHVVPICS
jgi:hypothetical protein